MPIVGGITENVTATLGQTTYVSTRFDVGEYSHSTVFTTSDNGVPTVTNLNLPPLTTIFTPPTQCADRWMLAGGQKVTRHMPPAGSRLLPRADTTIYQNTTVFSLDLEGTATDPSYRSCQPYALAPTYSPGVCPYGQTIAEITAWQISAATGGHRTFWQASCCKSGMTFGPEYSRACISTFSTPIEAHALLTASSYSGATAFTTYEYATSSFVGTRQSQKNNDGYSTWTISSVTTLTTGLAIADPIVVAWQVTDFSTFPSAYATSLAKRIGVDMPASTPGELQGSGTPSPGLSTGAKVGIGATVGILAAIVGIAFVLLRLRKRRKNKANPKAQAMPEMEDQDSRVVTRKWFLGGKWRSEVQTETAHQELDSKTAHQELDSKMVRQELDSNTVHVVSGPPAELAGTEVNTPPRNGGTHQMNQG